MKYLIFIAASICAGPLWAQEESGWKEASQESQAYHEYRLKITTPPYGLEKVKKVIAGIREREEDMPQQPDAKVYQALTLREKFTYHMIYGETYSQNCDVMPPIQEEQDKIFGQLPDPFGEYHWSERQEQFFKKNRDSVMILIKESVTRSKRIGLNYKQAIVLLDGKEMIPFLASICKANTKDHDILTVLMLLMAKGNDSTFISSASYRKLYGPASDYRAYLEYNKANENLILERAMAFYNNHK